MIQESIYKIINNIKLHTSTNSNSTNISNPTNYPPIIFKTTFHNSFIRSKLREIILKKLPKSMKENEIEFNRLIIAFKRQKT